MAERKREEEEGTGDLITHFKSTPTKTTLTSPHFLKVLPPPTSTKLGTKPLTHEPLRDIQDPNYRS
jgi:hypothetical protein